MTLKDAKQQLAKHYVRLLKRDAYGCPEYRVSIMGQSEKAEEDGAYYTDDLDDAISTGLAMADAKALQAAGL